MLHELRTFCEDNNVSPPGPLEEVRARPELTYVYSGDPALEIEAEPAVRIAVGARTVYIQRVIYELRYLLLEGDEPFEQGDVPGGNPGDEARLHQTVAALLGIARVWLGGGTFDDLRPFGRRPLI